MSLADVVAQALGTSGPRDEHVAVADLRAAADLHEAIARRWLGG